MIQGFDDADDDDDALLAMRSNWIVEDDPTNFLPKILNFLPRKKKFFEDDNSLICGIEIFA